jgi:hypothetical protein
LLDRIIEHKSGNITALLLCPGRVIGLTLGDVFEQSFRAIQKYSINGVAIPPADKNYIDLKNSMYVHADACQKDLSKILKIHDEMEISQNPITNQLGTAFDEIQVYPGGAYEYICEGSKSFSVEVDTDCSIQFDEDIDGTWTPLNGTYAVDGILAASGLAGSLSVTPTKFTNYRGLLTISDAAHDIRMKVIPIYPGKIRNRFMSAYTFKDASKVPWYKDYIPYNLPSNWFEFNKIMRHHDSRLFVENKDYILTPDNKIHLNWFLTGQFTVHGWKNPATITPDTSDEYVIEIADDGAALMPYYVGGYAINKTRPDIGVQLINQYYELRNMLKSPKSNTSSCVENTMWAVRNKTTLFRK